mmetsp:Transcript_22780/g.47296  ORF Transcript_22780/g.47296 Transcript_22780/m.47296 type:complete len:252 (-) Transcript_22780:201-956(-)
MVAARAWSCGTSSLRPSATRSFSHSPAASAISCGSSLASITALYSFTAAASEFCAERTSARRRRVWADGSHASERRKRASALSSRSSAVYELASSRSSAASVRPSRLAWTIDLSAWSTRTLSPLARQASATKPHTTGSLLLRTFASISASSDSFSWSSRSSAMPAPSHMEHVCHVSHPWRNTPRAASFRPSWSMSVPSRTNNLSGGGGGTSGGAPALPTIIERAAVGLGLAESNESALMYALTASSTAPDA